MKFEKTRVSNFKNAFRGMRNPLNSWGKSDSFFGLVNLENSEKDYDIAYLWNRLEYSKYPEEWDAEADDACQEWDRWLLENGVLERDFENMVAEVAFIGPQDMDLAQRLIKAGPEHRKFLRQIFISVDITAPLYW